MNISLDPLQEVHGVHINICIALKTKVSAVEVIFLQEDRSQQSVLPQLEKKTSGRHSSRANEVNK